MVQKLGFNFVSALMGGRQELTRFLEHHGSQNLDPDTLLNELVTKGLTYCFQPVVGSSRHETIVFGGKQIFKAGFPKPSAYLEAIDPLNVFRKPEFMIPVTGLVVTIPAGQHSNRTVLKAALNGQVDTTVQLTPDQLRKIFYSRHEATWR